MVNARKSHGHAYGLFINPEDWRILAGGNTPGNRPITLHPGRVLESAVDYPIRPISPIRPIPPHPKSTLTHPKPTVDLGCEPLIRVENGLISLLSPTCYKPIIRPENIGIWPKSNRHRPKKFITSQCYSDIPQSDTQQRLASKALHPICVNSRNSCKKRRVSVAKKEILILPLSLVHPVKASPGKSNLIQHFLRKNMHRYAIAYSPFSIFICPPCPQGWPFTRATNCTLRNPMQHPPSPSFFWQMASVTQRAGACRTVAPRWRVVAVAVRGDQSIVAKAIQAYSRPPPGGVWWT